MQGALTGWFSQPCFLYQLKGEIIMEKTYVHSIRDRPDPDETACCIWSKQKYTFAKKHKM